MSKSNNEKSYGLESGIFGGLILITLVFILLYLPSYMSNNPPVCIIQSPVKEIIALEGNKVIIKIKNGEIIKIDIEQYNVEEKKFKNFIKINEPVCLEYKSKIDVFLAELLLN